MFTATRNRMVCNSCSEVEQTSCSKVGCFPLPVKFAAIVHDFVKLVLIRQMRSTPCSRASTLFFNVCCYYDKDWLSIMCNVIYFLIGYISIYYCLSRNGSNYMKFLTLFDVYTNYVFSLKKGPTSLSKSVVEYYCYC